MKIELKPVTIRELFNGYADNDEEGVFGYSGRLNIRPRYQREFIYNERQEKAVIDSVRKGFPLNVMYWTRNADGTFDLLDGQQRTLSICRYLAGEYFVDWDGRLLGFANLTEERRERLLDYRLMVYVCEGGDDERLDWFRTINIAGEKLTEQEIRNAVFAGAWVTDAKRYFSRTACAAFRLGGDYMSGSCIRQEYLETVLRWIADLEGVKSIDEYMAAHQHDANAAQLWQYFQKVVNQAQVWFPRYVREMKGVDWGFLYNRHRDGAYDSTELAREVSRLLEDPDVTRKSGIFPYLITGRERELSIRAFDSRMRREAYERQGGRCAHCGLVFDLAGMEADHITPWSKGGRTVAENCQMLCRDCNRRKSDA